MRLPSVSKTVRLAAATAALLIACFPTEPCACTPPLSTLVVRGSVLKHGAAVSDAIVQVEAYSSTSCASTRLVLVGEDHVARTAANGDYTLWLATPLTPATRCLRLVVRPTSLGGADSLVVAGVQGTFRTHAAPDTLRLNFAIP
jgi:hypothetical protein